MTPTQVEAIALKIFNASLPALTLEESRIIAEHALTAAAEVGGQNIGSEAGVCATHILRDKELIERCAQLAESGDDLYGIRKDVAAEIRALKDKP